MSHYEYVLDTIPEVDKVLVIKSEALPGCLPNQRELVCEQINCLLELRLLLDNKDWEV